MVAVNVKEPDGLVSEAAYISSTPPGNPTRFTSAVSLVDLMEIAKCTGVPFSGTATTGELSDTEIGGPIGNAPVLVAPHPFNAQTTAASMNSLELAAIWWPFAGVLAFGYLWYIARYFSGKVEVNRDGAGPYLPTHGILARR